MSAANVDRLEMRAITAVSPLGRGQRQWYAPDGRELTLFAQWLPVDVGFVLETDPAAHYSARSRSLSNFSNSLPTHGDKLGLVHKKRMSLPSLLAVVSQAVAQPYKAVLSQ